jgi:succinoglycan biosynthesis protein ExoA
LLPLAALAVLPLAGWHPVFVLPLAGWALLCLVVGFVVGLKKGGGWACLSGLAAGAMHLAWAIGFVGGLRSPPAVEAPDG